MNWLLLALTIAVLIYLGGFRPQWLIILLLGAVALDISKTWYPDIPFLGSALGMITLARLTTYAIIISAFLHVLFNSDYRKRLGEIFTQPVTWAILLYFIIAVVSYKHSFDQSRTLVEGLRLLVYIALYFSVVLFTRFRFNPLFPLHIVHLVGLGLAPLTFYERLTGHLIWQDVNALGDYLRVNATFVDPNIFARFLVLAIVANLILQYLANSAWERRIYLVGLFVLLGQLVITMSRGGLLTLAVVMVFILIMLRSKRIALPVGITGGLGLGAVLLNPTMLERFLKIQQDLTSVGSERLYLIKVGVRMFQDNPLWGVGLGAFQTRFLTNYIDYKTVGDGVSLSHTSVITVMAELGWLGLISLSLLMLSLIYALYSLSQKVRHTFVLGIGYFGWILTIFVSAQMEARFFEDPVLWVSMAMLVSLVINSKDEHFISNRSFQYYDALR
ncbi:O-antigen ligase family protein [Desulfitobacterium sp. THU1]|uniref:O-antigen ligase family protein n=1 Tax=Desulfitobacterium sp. THU1 TaxID=3138072 RepID=UPI00311D7BCE